MANPGIQPRNPLSSDPPSFAPHPWLANPHAQTVVGRFLGLPASPPSTTAIVPLEDGDRLLVYDSVPPRWSDGRPAAVLIHGLAGCAQATYVVRLARRLLALGIRVVRMNLRNAGEGFGLAVGVYHAGRDDDVRAVVDWLAERAPAAPIAVVGFSLGASIALKLAAELQTRPSPAIDAVLAANPPLELSACAIQIARPENRVYDRSFVRWLKAATVRLHDRFPELGSVDLSPVRSVRDFDDHYTAPRNGFASAEHYYTACSAGPRLGEITAPTLIVHAADDPFIPVSPFLRELNSGPVEVDLATHGGHLGYISREPWLGDRRWLEARLAHWLARRWGLAARKP